MGTIRVQKHIQAPVEAVFDYTSDFEHAAQRIEAIQEVEMLTPGPIGVGSRFKETRIVFKKSASETMEVVEFDRPHRYALTASSCGNHYLTSFNFKEKEGGTEIEVVFESTPETFMAKLMSPLMAMMSKTLIKMFMKDLEDIEEALLADGKGGDARI